MGHVFHNNRDDDDSRAENLRRSDRGGDTASRPVMDSSALYVSLRGLLAAALKGREAYAWVADRASSSEVRRLVQRHELRCAANALELERVCEALWRDEAVGALLPPQFHVELSPLRQTWFSLRAMLGRSDDSNLVEMCLAGERANLTRYVQVLGHDMSRALRETLGEQRFGIEGACADMGALFDKIDSDSRTS